MNIFKTHNLTYQQLIDLVELTDRAKGPDISESEHYQKVAAAAVNVLQRPRNQKIGNESRESGAVAVKELK